jgi:HAD superfamily hydrolase (TIGR01509 family)
MKNLDIKNLNIWKKILGVTLVFLGFLALITPLTPGSWLAVIGLELLGLRVLFFDKLKKVLCLKSSEKNIDNTIKAIIFDMDGVIVDSEPIHEKAEMETCREFGMEVSKDEWDGFRGKKLEDIFSYASKKYGTGNEPIEEMIKRKIERYLSLALAGMEPVPGAYEFLQKLKRSGKYRYALTTSGRKFQQDQILAKIGLSGFFEDIVTADNVKNGKPHPEPYAKTVEKLDLQPAECLVIEDSDNGIISAKAAGCLVCGITTTFSREKLQSAGADFVVDGFSELADMLEIK